MNNFRLESIKKYPETILRTIDRGVVFCCPSCDMELDPESIAVKGIAFHRKWSTEEFRGPRGERIDPEHYPRCPHCRYMSYEVLAKTVQSYKMSYQYMFALPPIDFKKYRKYEHVLKIKKGWFGREKIIDSVFETIEIKSR